MAQRRAPGSPSSRDVGKFDSRGAARPRRVLTAFLLGAALSAMGVGAFVASGAAARGPFTAASPTPYAAPAATGGAAYRPSYSVFHLESLADVPRRPRDEPFRERITLAKVSGFSTQQAVCVRLCDGFFFPLSASADGSQAAACDSQCPDAPTEVYYRNGSDRIEDAISASGRPYTALPVSLRYRRASDHTCACHREAVAYAPLRDRTLRPGDAVMTPAGFVVFNGAESGAPAPRDFAALGQARLPEGQRYALQAMERVSLERVHPSLQSWLVSQGAPARTAEIKARPPLSGGAVVAQDKIRLLVWRGAQD
jgi:hypothetical protein